MKSFLLRILTNAFVVNFLIAAILIVVITLGTLKWMDHYTNHNEAVTVPDVKGLTIDKAAPFLESSKIKYKVVDSVFSKTVEPGSIVEIIPEAGSKVKEGRTIFITVNALTSQMALVPRVKDLSYRQAYAMLRAAGFKSIEIEYKAGQYKDLVIGVTYRNELIEEEKRLPLAAHLVLQISSGNPDELLGDSLDIEGRPIQPLESEDEKWF